MKHHAIVVPLLSSVLFACANARSESGSPEPASTSEVQSVARDREVQAADRPPRKTTARVTEPDAPSLDPIAQAFLDAHNQARATVSPAPSVTLPTMRWSEPLAKHAKKVAGQCRFEHSNSDYGENLAARTGSGEPAEYVADWVAEVEHYNAATNRCKPGEVCGHYTQVVWRKSTELGCAIQVCDRGSPFGSGEWTMTVCNYAPAGNYTGQRPY
jgi:uncharacterized protein YkwD